MATNPRRAATTPHHFEPEAVLRDLGTSLTALTELLALVHEHSWCSRVDDYRSEWYRRQSCGALVRELTSIGPFHELRLLPENGHALTTRQVPWANALLDWLRSTAAVLTFPPHEMDAEQLRRSVRRDTFLPAQFRRRSRPIGRPSTQSIRASFEVHRCSRCGRRWTVESDLELSLAAELVPRELLARWDTPSFSSIAGDTAGDAIPHFRDARNIALDALRAAAVDVTASTSRRCHHCSSDLPHTRTRSLMLPFPSRTKPDLIASSRCRDGRVTRAAGAWDGIGANH